MSIDPRPFLLLACAVVGVVAGCRGNAPEIVEIEGTVTYKGKPVPNLKIYFVPASGRPSWGLSDEQGRFKLDYDYDYDGAKVGTHTIYVMDGGAMDPTAMATPGVTAPKKSPDLPEILAKYGNLETSPLKVEVTRPDKNFQLQLD